MRFTRRFGVSVRNSLIGEEDLEKDDYYHILGVSRDTVKLELKKSFRKLALKYHPDVNPSVSATKKFIKLSTAYEVLVDDELRAVYDEFGIEGVERYNREMAGSGGSKAKGRAAWEAFDTWEEFQPYERKTRKGDARAAAARFSQQSFENFGYFDSSDDSESTNEGKNLSGAFKDFFSSRRDYARESEGGKGGEREIEGADVPVAQTGDVVEYPLSEAARNLLRDGRVKGVGFVVGRNMDRGDRHRLSAENLELCEIEPLYCEEWNDTHDQSIVSYMEWKTDPMESAAFPKLSELRVLNSRYDRSKDVWYISDVLSEGCGSPEYEEEIIV